MTTHALLDAAAELRRTGEEFLIATVVDVRGSAYRRPGARMVVTRERWLAGSVSGGCLEGDIVHKGFWRAAGGPVVVTYDSTRAEDDADDDVRDSLALGCNGAVDVLLERGDSLAIDPLAVLARCVHEQKRMGLATVIRTTLSAVPVGTRLSIDSDGSIEGSLAPPALHATVSSRLRATVREGTTHVLRLGGIDVLFEVMTPPPRLFVLGGGHDAVPVVAQARALGWDVLVCLRHARPVARERFAAATGFVFGTPGDVVRAIDASHRAAAVVMNHHYEHDRASLAALVSSNASYIGVLGPRHRCVRMLGDLGLSYDTRLHAPVGLALGAETPEEIALAIVAEVQAALTESAASRLRDWLGPIHATAALTAEP